MYFDSNSIDRLFKGIEERIDSINLSINPEVDASSDSSKENIVSNKINYQHNSKKGSPKENITKIRMQAGYDIDMNNTDSSYSDQESNTVIDQWQVSKSPCKSISQSRTSVAGIKTRSTKIVSPVKLKRKSDFYEEPTVHSSKLDVKSVTNAIEEKLKEISLRTPDSKKSSKLVVSRNSPSTVDRSKATRGVLKSSPIKSDSEIKTPSMFPRSAKKSLNYVELNRSGKQSPLRETEENVITKNRRPGSARRKDVSSPSTQRQLTQSSPRKKRTPNKSLLGNNQMTSSDSSESEASPKSKRLEVNHSPPRSAKRSLKYREVSPRRKISPQKSYVKNANNLNLSDEDTEMSLVNSGRKRSARSSKKLSYCELSPKKKRTPQKSTHKYDETDSSDELDTDSEHNCNKSNLNNKRPSRSTKHQSYCEVSPKKEKSYLEGRNSESSNEKCVKSHTKGTLERKRHTSRSSKRSLSFCELSPEEKKTPNKSQGRRNKRDDFSEDESDGKPAKSDSLYENGSSPATPNRFSRKSNVPFPPSPLLKDGTRDAKTFCLRSPKVPLHDDDFIYTMKRTAVASPRTPSTSLRKLVLESRTPTSAKKKLVMEDDEVKCIRTPAKKSPLKTPKKSPLKTPKKTPSKRTPCKDETASPKVGKGFLTPSYTPVKKSDLSSIDRLRMSLHTAAAPESLPCREEEFADIYSFVESKILNGLSGSMYISGVPGTGKTATVHGVVKALQKRSEGKKFPSFDFVEINGLRVTEPRQAYVRLWQCLSGQKLSIDQSLRHLEKKFSSKPKKATVVLADELDYLCNRRQDVVYNILDWPSIAHSKLIVLSIANTMDLPERTLKGKVTSRMGLTRLVFQPYNFKQLQEIVANRISDSKHFHVDAVQLVARKVAAVSGDARRALGICRRATEMLKDKEDLITVEHISQVLEEIFSGPRIIGIKYARPMEQMTLRAIRDEALRTGIEETRVIDMYSHFKALCNLEGKSVPGILDVYKMCCALARYGFINMEKGRKDILTKICLNVSPDDIHYALSV